MKHQGRCRYRLDDNPEERRFADAWEKMNFRDDRGVLFYLVNGMQQETSAARYPTQDEATLVATAIQWLGSPVGRGFLHSLGYVKEEKP